VLAVGRQRMRDHRSGRHSHIGRPITQREMKHSTGWLPAESEFLLIQLDWSGLVIRERPVPRFVVGCRGEFTRQAGDGGELSDQFGGRGLGRPGGWFLSRLSPRTTGQVRGPPRPRGSSCLGSGISGAGGLRRGHGVLLVDDGLEPGGAVALPGAFEHRDVAHDVAGSAAVPVLLAGWNALASACSVESLQPERHD